MNNCLLIFYMSIVFKGLYGDCRLFYDNTIMSILTLRPHNSVPFVSQFSWLLCYIT